jgi:hypothetical protein
VLDLVLGTKEDLVENLNVGDEFVNSDHRIVTFSIKFDSSQPNISKEKVPNFKKANFHKLRTILRDNDWNITINNDDINKSWEHFTTTYSKAVKACIPLKNRRSVHNDKPKWWNKDTADCLRAKKNAHDRLKIMDNDEERAKFIELRRKSKKLIKQSKKNLELHVANQSKTNPKEFYSYIRKKKVITTTIGPLINENGDYTKDEVEMSNTLNTFCVSFHYRRP